MDSQIESLNRLLRCEMTAVHQQFIHVLALRDWGHIKAADEILRVDRVDFPNAMKVIDFLVETGAPISLQGPDFIPGRTHRGIFVAEQAQERRLLDVIERGTYRDERPAELFANARAPRNGYAEWLRSQLDQLGDDADAGPDHAPETPKLFGCLLTMIEQATIHAFVHWYNGDVDLADAAWATSGAAMMQATEFVHLFAAQRTVPLPGRMPPSEIEYSSADALASDRRLARRCALEATEVAVACTRSEVADLCKRVATYSSELSRFSLKIDHPAAEENPPAFGSFEATLQKFVSP